MDPEDLKAVSISDETAQRLGEMLVEEGGPPITPHKNADGSTSMRWFGYDVPMAAVVSVAVGLLMIVATSGQR